MNGDSHRAVMASVGCTVLVLGVYLGALALKSNGSWTLIVATLILCLPVRLWFGCCVVLRDRHSDALSRKAKEDAEMAELRAEVAQARKELEDLRASLSKAREASAQAQRDTDATEHAGASLGGAAKVG